MLIPMIARAYGAQIMRPNGLSAINSTEFRTAINRTILQLWSENRPSANRQFVPNNAEFQQWQAEPLADPFALQPTFCCQQASPFGPGMAIVSPVQVGSGIGDIQVGYVPTDAGYFGATAFGLLRGSLNPSFALSMVSYILSPDNTYSADIAAVRGMVCIVGDKFQFAMISSYTRQLDSSI